MEIKIEYDGKWPNLCSGRLVVTIQRCIIEGADGVWDFGTHVLRSGGAAGCTPGGGEFCMGGDWGIEEWPECFPRQMRASVTVAVNEQVEHGCCGGCQ
jgi:hypothetical protein